MRSSSSRVWKSRSRLAPASCAARGSFMPRPSPPLRRPACQQLRPTLADCRACVVASLFPDRRAEFAIGARFAPRVAHRPAAAAAAARYRLKSAIRLPLFRVAASAHPASVPLLSGQMRMQKLCQSLYRSARFCRVGRRSSGPSKWRWERDGAGGAAAVRSPQPGRSSGSDDVEALLERPFRVRGSRLSAPARPTSPARPKAEP